MSEKIITSIQEVFAGEFAGATSAVVQKLRPDEHNLQSRDLSFTESWPTLKQRSDVLVLSLGEKGARRRQVLAGFITDLHPSIIYPGRFRFYVERFRSIGIHALDFTPDGDFYGTGGGGGSRIYVSNQRHVKGSSSGQQRQGEDDTIPEGAMERRLVWVRKNHHRFRDPVWKHWEGRCAVTDADCNGLLVASHIHPWARSTPAEKTDPHNGLLLSVPLDSLFDRGWISFRDTGEMIVKASLSPDTRSVFGVQDDGLCIRRAEKISAKMRRYLERHRTFYGFDYKNKR